MSYKAGMAALNLELTDMVPRTEYSVEAHWDLVKHVTGIDGRVEGNADKAKQALMKAWDFSFKWATFIHGEVLGGWHTSMGHAAYSADGGDKKNQIYCSFKDEDEVLAFDPLEKLGEVDIEETVKRFNVHYQKNVDYLPDAVNMTGIYVTCMSGLIEMFGWDMLLTAAGVDPEGFGKITNRYCDWMKQYFIALAKSDAPVVMLHDDIVWTSGAFLHPDWYRKYIFPNYKKMFAPLHEAGKKIMYTSDGNYTEFVDDIAACGVNCFVIEPTTDMAYIAEKHGKTHAFIGNADTRVLLHGTKEDIYNEVKRCMDIGKKCPGFFMAVGNHIPANTPIDSCLYYDEYYRKLGKR